MQITASFTGEVDVTSDSVFASKKSVLHLSISTATVVEAGINRGRVTQTARRGYLSFPIIEAWLNYFPCQLNQVKKKKKSKYIYIYIYIYLFIYSFIISVNWSAL